MEEQSQAEDTCLPNSGPENPETRVRGWPDPLQVLGPGLITGAADDDPSGIATYSQVGAQFGYTLGWTMVLSYPLMAVVQGISAGIGAVTGQGIASNLRRHYPRWVLYGAVALLLFANVINIGADLDAMAASLRLLVHGSQLFYSIGFALLCVGLEVFVSYRRYVHVLRWLTLSLFAYVAVLFVVNVPWAAALKGALIPHLVLDRDHATALVALLGTTISPYLFFWQAGEEVEELRRRMLPRLGARPRRATPEIRRIQIDTLVGMAFSNAIALFIIFASASTLHVAGITQVDTAAQASEALRPIAGQVAFAVFAAGIIGAGLLAVPVLAGSSAYALAETFRWSEGLDRRPRDAKAFYITIAVATIGSLLIGYLGFDPMAALYWSAVVNGVLAAPLLALMVVVASNRRIMGRLTAPRWMTFVGWMSVAVIAAATIGLFVL